MDARVVHMEKAVAGRQATSKAELERLVHWTSSSTILGDDAEPRRGLAPNGLEVAANRFDPFIPEAVEVAGPDGLLFDEARLLQEAKVTRHGGPTDRKLLCDLVDRPVTLPKHGEDLAPVAIGEGVEGSGLICHRRTSRWSVIGNILVTVTQSLPSSNWVNAACRRSRFGKARDSRSVSRH